jgi:hypothetical protein
MLPAAAETFSFLPQQTGHKGERGIHGLPSITARAHQVAALHICLVHHLMDGHVRLAVRPYVRVHPCRQQPPHIICFAPLDSHNQQLG